MPTRATVTPKVLPAGPGWSVTPMEKKTVAFFRGVEQTFHAKSERDIFARRGAAISHARSFQKVAALPPRFFIKSPYPAFSELISLSENPILRYARVGTEVFGPGSCR